jgi:hypothetical protein
MAQKTGAQGDPSDEMNIRSPEERYGGEGHAGSDPFARPKRGRDKTGEHDSAVEVPNVTVDDLVQQPASAPERAEDDSGTPGGPAPPQTR